jgi:hypothetical protein
VSILSWRWESRGRSHSLFNALGYQLGDMDPNLAVTVPWAEKQVLRTASNCYAYIGFRKGIQHWHDISREAAAVDFAEILDTLGTHICGFWHPCWQSILAPWSIIWADWGGPLRHPGNYLKHQGMTRDIQPDI